MGRLTRSGWFSASYSLGKRGSRRNHSTRPEARRLRLEQLEQRTLLAAFSVTNANSDGAGSLRQAVLDANAAPGADSITFVPGLAGATINTVNLLITDDVDIQGPLNGPVILSGPAPSFRNFPDAGGGRILDIAAGASVSISRLSLMNGNVTDPFITGDSFGGAIRNAGTLTVRQSQFYNNGMGLATGGGGAIYNSGSLTVIASSFAANFADWNSSGGAIYNAGTATVTNSTFIDNMAGISGGSIFNATGGTLTVNNSTILKSGGNALSSGFPVFPAGHGGISNLGTMIMNNTIVADTFIGSDIENSGVLTGSHNLIKDGSGGVPGTITGDPMLEAPVYTQANSSFPALALLPRPGQYGPPFTFSPLPGSPAIDAGNNSAVSSFGDQRGAPRINNGVVDIGAVEVGIAPVSIVVTTLTDESNGSIDAALGAGTSLREALSLILPEDVTITFAPGLAGVIALDPSLASLRIIGSHDTDLSPRGDVTIVGPGADVITIDGLAQTRILEINPFPLVRDYSGLVSISGLTFARGTTNSSEGGGAIFALSNLTLTDCFFVNNSSEFVPSPSTIRNGGGGAIGARANLSVINCTFSNNSAAAQGGAIWNESEMIVKDSTFIGNSALRGGAIWVESYNRFQGPFIRPTVTSSTFSENTATEYGGAIFIGSYRSHLSPAELSVINSTISNNSAGLNGGGIHVAGDLFLYGSTVYGNSAASAGPTVAGGIAVVDLPVELNHARLVTLANSIVAGSTSGADLTTFLLLSGTVTGSHNLIGDGSGGLPNTITGDPLLGPLADNGGPTKTHALLPGSPAIDAGDPAFDPNAFTPPLVFDQRGASFARVIGGRIDLGAVEAPTMSADFDADGDVDGADFLIWQRGLGSTGASATQGNGNADQDNDVDADDLAVWKAQFGNPAALAAAEPLAAAAVVASPAALPAAGPGPEPLANAAVAFGVIPATAWVDSRDLSDDAMVRAPFRPALRQPGVMSNSASRRAAFAELAAIPSFGRWRTGDALPGNVADWPEGIADAVDELLLLDEVDLIPAAQGWASSLPRTTGQYGPFGSPARSKA